jgi:hypothetical protein
VLGQLGVSSSVDQDDVDSEVTDVSDSDDDDWSAAGFDRTVRSVNVWKGASSC